MIDTETSLAQRIGRQRIAVVVDKFYERIRIHPTLAEPFREVDDWAIHKERLTYFWWITLGGAKERILQFDVVPKHRRAGFNDSFLEDWVALFREIVYSTVDEQLAAAWMKKVYMVGRALLIANRSHEMRVGSK